MYQVAPNAKDPSKKDVKHKVIAKIAQAHNVHDINCVVWCPREGSEDLFATAADDGLVKVWKVAAS